MFYGVYIAHKKDPKVESYFTNKYTSLSKEMVKEAIESCNKRIRVTKIILIDKPLTEEYEVSMFQGLRTLDILYNERRWERMKIRFKLFGEKIRKNKRGKTE